MIGSEERGKPLLDILDFFNKSSLNNLTRWTLIVKKSVSIRGEESFYIGKWAWWRNIFAIGTIFDFFFGWVTIKRKG